MCGTRYPDARHGAVPLERGMRWGSPPKECSEAGFGRPGVVEASAGVLRPSASSLAARSRASVADSRHARDAAVDAA